MLKSISIASLLFVVALTVEPCVAEAKCFGFRGQTIRVCVDGDQAASRRTAIAVCERVSGQSCSIAGYSGSCQRSSSVRCYDAGGREQRSIQSE